MVTIKLKFKQPHVEACKESLGKEKHMTLFLYMEQLVERYNRQGQIRTGETYMSTLNSFRRFRDGVDISMSDIDGSIMEMYESYLKQRGLARNTVSFYIKHIRAVYNRALEEGLVEDNMPFRRVSVKAELTPKRAIPLEMIKKLRDMDCSCNLSRQFAKDMFLFSFYTRGMSFVDIALLQKKDLKGEILSYRRRKTGQRLLIRWEACMQEILQRYQSDPTSPYLLSIIKHPDKDVRKQYLNTMFLVNRHLRIIGKELGLSQTLTMYCARHSWASIARDEGIPVNVISEGMGHDSEKTTQIYLTSLKTEVIDKANRKIIQLL